MQPEMNEEKPVLELVGVTLVRRTKGEAVQLVKDVTLSIRPGEMAGLVGESGSGKSLTAAAVLGLLPRHIHVESGEIRLSGRSLRSLPERSMRQLRGRRIALISQSYQDSFTPFFTIGRQLAEALRTHMQLSKQEAKEVVLSWLERVKLPAARVYNSYPFQLSGGQLQRAAIAGAVMLEPDVIIADEPTTALDVLTGELVLDVLAQLQRETGCAVLFISHNLAQVMKRTDRMFVMYGGCMMESGPTEQIRQQARHPYTRLLLQARPQLAQAAAGQLVVLPGEAGAVSPAGCPFLLRCPVQTAACRHMPDMHSLGGGHCFACHTGNQEENEYGAITATS